MVRLSSSQVKGQLLLLVGALLISCSSANDAKLEKLTQGLIPVLMVPTSDVAADGVFGVGDPVNLYRNVDDGTRPQDPDDDVTYVRLTNGRLTGSHTAGYTSATQGVVTRVDVTHRARRFSPSRGTIRIALYDGNTLVATGPTHNLGNWSTVTDAFTNVFISSASQVRTQAIFNVTSALGGLAYTNIFVQAYVDPNAVSVSFNTANSYGSETLGASDIPVSLTTVSNQTVTVNWAVTGGTATNGADYSMLPGGVPNGTLTFAPGELMKTIRVATVRDDLVENNETVTLALSNPVNTTLGAQATHTFTIYDSPPRNASGDRWADVVLGQRDHTEATTNMVVANHVFNPAGVAVDRSAGAGTNGRAYVWDGGNNRILGLNLDTCYGYPLNKACDPALVIGQPSGQDWGSCNQDASMSRYPLLAPASASTVCGTAGWYISPKEAARISGMTVDQATGDLYVPDYENHRVLIFNSPFTDATPTIADDVIGQDDFSGVYCNKVPYNRTSNYDANITPPAAPTASSLCAMSDDLYSTGFGAALDAAGNLWVADGGNNRVLRFSKDPVTHKISKSASLVLGQPDFIHRGSGPAVYQMHGPQSLGFGLNGRLYVSDGSALAQGLNSPNSRVLFFDPPFVNGMSGTALSNGVDTKFVNAHLTTVTTGNGAGIWITRWVPIQNYFSFQVQQFDLNGTPGPILPQVAGLVPNNVGGALDVDKIGNVLVPGTRDNSDVYVYHSSNYNDPPGSLFYPQLNGRYNITSNSHIFAANGIGISSSANQLYITDQCRIMIWNNILDGQGHVLLTNEKTADAILGVGQLGGFCYGEMKVDNSGRVWATNASHSPPPPTQPDIEVFQSPLSSMSKTIADIHGPLPVLNSPDIVPDLGGGFSIPGIVPTPDGLFLWVAITEQHRVLRIRNPLTAPVVDVVLGQLNIHDTACNQNLFMPPHGGVNNLLCKPSFLSLDRNGNLYIDDHVTEGQGNMRMVRYDAATIPTNNTRLYTAADISASYEYPAQQATYEPAFDSTNRMVVGYDSFGGLSVFPGVYPNPLNTNTPSSYLNDHYVLAGHALFDAFDNMYIADTNHTKVYIYKHPF